MVLHTIFRCRRRHQKSRNGCTRCKQQRKKCDERKPSCTRCTTYGHRCCYQPLPHRQFDPEQQQRETLTQHALLVSDYPDKFEDGFTFDSRLSHSATTFTFLGTAEMSLLYFYISETSRTVAYDTDELFVLKVGIPALAASNRPLTASMLALASASKCYDLTRKSSLTTTDLHILNDLLVAADRYYDISLRETRLAVGLVECYDHVLANATLLVLYGLASYSVRIRLENMTKRRDSEPSHGWVKAPCQWMRLIRSTCMAYINLQDEPASNASSKDQTSQLPGLGELERSVLPEDDTLTSESGPSKTTEILFLPIVVSTYKAAFQKLQIKVRALKTSPLSDISSSCQSTDRHLLTHNDCLNAFEILKTISSELFDGNRLDHEAASYQASDYGLSPGSLLSRLSPWLRTYVARVTSIQPSRPLRRTITSFINRISVGYFDFIQQTFDNMPLGTVKAQDLNPDKYTSSWSTLEQVALDILAHWLVLVMLLDGVWWIGDLGKWELARLISEMETQRVPGCQVIDWWPRSMWNIHKEISNQQSIKDVNVG